MDQKMGSRDKNISTKKDSSASALGRPDDKHNDRLEQILLVSARLFSEKGYVSTSLQDIADGVGIHKATLYHYIDSKDSILFQCLSRSFADLDALEVRLHASELPVLERLRLFVRCLAVAQNSEFGRCLILIGLRPLESQSSKEVRGFQRRLDKIVRDLIHEGIRLGVIRDCSPKLASAFLFGALNWVPQWYEPNGPLKLATIIEEFISFLELGLSVKES